VSDTDLRHRADSASGHGDAGTTTPYVSAAVPDTSSLRAALLSEWTKFRSVRSTVWCLALVAIFHVGVGALLCWSWVNRPRRRLRDVFEFDPTSQSLSGVALSMLAIGVLGVLVMSSEHTTGMIRTSLAAVPRRRLMLLAKAIVLTTASVVVSAASIVVAFLIGQAILESDGSSTHLGAPNVLRALAGAATFLTLIAVLGLAIGTVVRRTPGALATLFGIVLILPLITESLPDPWDEQVGKFTPLFAGTVLFSVRVDEDYLSPRNSLLILLVWVAVWAVAAVISNSRRDP
jgi:ABC-2 type transport system permease protein